MAWLVWILVFGISFAVLGTAAGPASERRPRFWVVLSLVPLIATCLVLLVLLVTPSGSRHGVMWALGLLALPVLMLGPPMLYRRPGPSPEPGEGEGGGGEGGGPDAPRSAPPAPRGGVPLPDAGPARVRLRDHDAARLVTRRPARRTVRRISG